MPDNAILLVNPYLTNENRYGGELGDLGGHVMPLGLYYLAAYLRKAGHTTDVIDAEARKITHEEIVQKLLRDKTRILGISSTTVAFSSARKLALLAREKVPGIKIVVGGPHISCLPELALETGAFDYGVAHEGEKPLSMLADYILRGTGTLETIPNLYYMKDGKPFSTGTVSFIDDINEIPFPARDLCPDLALYKPSIGNFRRLPSASIMTSRGCPYECIFCDNNTFGRKVRFFSADYVAREIKSLIKDYGIREIIFMDDTFVLDKKRLREIFAILKADGISFPWTCHTRVNNLDKETIKFMADNGCWQFRVGIESGNQQVIDFIKKSITLEQVRNAAQWAREVGINMAGYFIVGHHIDTPETIEQTIRFAMSIPLVDAIVLINTPMPGTESYRLARKYGKLDESDWNRLNYWTPVFEPNGLTREFLLEKQSEFYRRFYFRPGIIIRQLAKIRSPYILFLTVKNLMLGLFFLVRRKLR